MEKDKMNKKLITELDHMKSWMKFLDNKSNFNKSFHKPSSTNPKLRESFREDDPNDQFGSPDQSSDELILGNDEQKQDVVSDGNFLVISIDINGEIYVKLTEAENENEALAQNENEMIIQNMVIAEDSLMELISKLSQYLPEEITAEDKPDKPPFIDEPEEDVIDEVSVNDVK